MTKCIELTVSGIVQGVFFRASTLQKANELNIKGWVRNMPNGDVQIKAEQDEHTLNLFLDWCKKGPIMARVKGVIVSEVELENHPNFRIIR